MRIALAVTGANVTLRLTRLLPLTEATVCHAPPTCACTSNAVTPYNENVIVSVGVAGGMLVFCTVYKTTVFVVFAAAEMVLAPAGKTPAGASVPPPQAAAPHTPLISAPLISPSLTLAIG